MNGWFWYLVMVAIVAAPGLALYGWTGELWLGILGLVVGVALLFVLPTLFARGTVMIGGRVDEKDAAHDAVRAVVDTKTPFAGPFAQKSPEQPR